MANETRQITNFDKYLTEQLNDPAFAERFREAGEEWELALKQGDPPQDDSTDKCN